MPISSLWRPTDALHEADLRSCGNGNVQRTDDADRGTGGPEPAGRAAFRQISHLLRPAHLKQLRSILDDPEASDNDRFVALDLLKNANIAAGMVLPMCQDTGTAIVMGKKGQRVWTGGGDEVALSEGMPEPIPGPICATSQMSPLTLYDEANTGNNLPAQIDLYADRRRRLQVPVHRQGRRLGQQDLPLSADPRC